MPTTWAPPPANRSWSEFSAGASLFQVLVNAKAKNASTTRRPRSFERVTSVPSCPRSVKSGAASPTRSVFVSVAILLRPFGAAIDRRLREQMSVDQRRRTVVDRHAFLAYAVQCPFCGTNVGPRFVTREHLDIPPKDRKSTRLNSSHLVISYAV